ncbi:MAG TPA: c-type cytochrome [Novimethylophilus sp.]|uniref:c-type cytochrome n=1 Tax=Novimethylophilus sp. TaxID=2137426 RepID=UPI002F40ACC0
MRMLNLAAFLALALSSTSNAADGRNIYKQTCATCHAAGSASEAPKLGVLADWRARLAGGRSSLLHSVMKGKGAMPPKGGNASISDAQANAALDYMLSRIEEGHD